MRGLWLSKQEMEPTDSEMQLMRDEVVKYKLSSEGEIEDLPSALLCSLPEEFGTQVLVVFVSGNGVRGSISLFGLFENKERSIDALREGLLSGSRPRKSALTSTEPPTR